MPCLLPSDPLVSFANIIHLHTARHANIKMLKSQNIALGGALADQQDALQRCQAAAAGRATLAEWQRALADWQEAQATIVAIRQGAEKEMETLDGEVQRLNLM